MNKAYVFFLGALMLAPSLLFAIGLLEPVYAIAAFLIAAYLAVLISNFEAGFLMLVFVRSSVDYLKQHTEAGGFNVSAAIGVLVILLGVFYVLDRRIRILEYEETGPFFLFLSVCGLSIFFCDDKVAGVSDWMRLLSLFFVYVLARNVCRSPQRVRTVLFLVLLSSVLPIGVAYYQLVTTMGQGRLQGTFYHPNAFASYLLLLLVFSSAQSMERRAMLPKAFFVAFTLTALVPFVFTFSRGAWLVFLLVMLLLGCLRYRKLLFFVPVIAVVAFAMLPGVRERIYDVLSPTAIRGRSAWEWRLEAWNEILPLISQNPVFGQGLSTIDVRLGYMAHNDYLRLLAETGVVGLLAYLGLILSVGMVTMRDLRASQTDATKSLQLGLVAILIGLLVREIADNTLRNTVVLIYFWIFVAICRSARRVERETVRA